MASTTLRSQSRTATLQDLNTSSPQKTENLSGIQDWGTANIKTSGNYDGRGGGRVGVDNIFALREGFTSGFPPGITGHLSPSQGGDVGTGSINMTAQYWGSATIDTTGQVAGKHQNRLGGADSLGSPSRNPQPIENSRTSERPARLGQTHQSRLVYPVSLPRHEEAADAETTAGAVTEASPTLLSAGNVAEARSLGSPAVTAPVASEPSQPLSQVSRPTSLPQTMASSRHSSDGARTPVVITTVSVEALPVSTGWQPSNTHAQPGKPLTLYRKLKAKVRNHRKSPSPA